ncbi:MAG: oxidoreductase [Eggerthellaceae bacterium]|nr:oxidoreductase [Eggerthellaceae bacterium]
MGKVFIVDCALCSGCHNCQVACKDEHCGRAWEPYAAQQPLTGQFWCRVDQKDRGTVPKVRVSYVPKFGAQDETIREFAPEAVQKRDDGLIVLDPEACRGRKDIADAFDGVYWNEELGLCQGCTGCAHLIDDGWDVPHCVDVCATGALRFGEAEDFADEIAAAEQLTPGSHVYYLNLPKRFVAGEVYDEAADEIIEGMKIQLLADDEVVAETESDDFGDFWFDQVEPAAYTVRFCAEGGVREMAADATELDVNVGSIAF